MVHYAGEVVYDIEKFLQKNMDHATDSVTQVISMINLVGAAESEQPNSAGTGPGGKPAGRPG